MRPNFPSLEETLKRMGDNPGWGSKFLIGGLLFFIPILHLFSLGYLLQYVRGIRKDMDLDLPEWTEWDRLFLDGLRMFVVWFFFFLLPILVGLFFHCSLKGVLPGIFGFGNLSIAWFFLAAGWVFGCYLFMAALYRYVALGEFKSLLDLKTIWRMAFTMRWQLALPVLLFTGLMILFLPVYGLALFLGTTIILAYSTLNFMLMERAASINQ